MFEIVVKNCDNVNVKYSYNSLEDFETEWNREDDMPVIPMLDDMIVSSKYNDEYKEYHNGEIVGDFFMSIAELKQIVE